MAPIEWADLLRRRAYNTSRLQATIFAKRKRLSLRLLEKGLSSLGKDRRPKR